MLVTIICDASFCPDTGVAGYGYWIASNRGKRGGSGAMKGTCANNTVAEMQAVVNALHVAVKSELVQAGDTVLIQTDCYGAIDTFNGFRKKIHAEEKSTVEAFLKVKTEAQVIVDFRHVKGHTRQTGARFATNRKCDQDARAHMRKARKNFLTLKRQEDGTSELHGEGPGSN